MVVLVVGAVVVVVVAVVVVVVVVVIRNTLIKIQYQTSFSNGNYCNSILPEMSH